MHHEFCNLALDRCIILISIQLDFIFMLKQLSLISHTENLSPSKKIQAHVHCPQECHKSLDFALLFE
jgi:hypothetical protein